MSTPSRRIALDGIHNLRDLGGHAHPAGLVPRNRFWRSDSLHELDAAGIEQLIEMGLTTVIDLRQDDEATDQPNPFTGHPDRVVYHNAPIFAGLDLRAPEIVDAEDPLFALYCQAVAERAERFVAVMQLIAAAPDGAVLFHCTVGKDRTGMIAAMLLKLAGVTDGDVVADYVETGGHIGPVLAALRVRAEANGWDVARMSRYWRSDAETMERFLAHLQARHGGAAAYLAAAGLTEPQLQAIQLRLTGPAASMPAAGRPLPDRST
jgi:protein-tyrosine phosphatase